MSCPLFDGVAPIVVALLLCVGCLTSTMTTVETNIVYTGNLFKCEVGQIFVIGGSTTANATGLSISLRDNDDIIIQLDFRIVEGTITRQTNINGTLTLEQNDELLSDPNATSLSHLIVPGQPFRVTIGVVRLGYLVAINGVHYCAYAHLQPPELVRSLHVAGDVRDLNQVDQRAVYPFTRPLRWTDLDPARFAISGAVPSYLRPGHRINLCIDISDLPATCALRQFRIRLQADGDCTAEAIILLASFSVGSPTVGDGRFVGLWELLGAETHVSRLPAQEELRPSGQPAETPVAIGRKEFRLTLLLAEDGVGVFDVLVDGHRFGRLQARAAVDFGALNGVRLEAWNGYSPRVRSIDHTEG